MTNSSWKVSSWTTPTTTVSVPPVPSEVSPESRSKISTNVSGQFASFIQDNFPTFIDFVKEYYKSQELKGYCFDIIQNWGDYYNIDNYGGLVEETTLIGALDTTTSSVSVSSTRDFPNEGIICIGNEIIYYQSKKSTLFENCTRGFNAVKTIGEVGKYNFEETVAASHAIGDKVVNLNNIFPLYVLGKFKEQFLSTYPKNFATGVTESTVIKRIKDFYSSKGSTRSFQFVLRTLFGVESEITYPRDRIFKPSDAYYTSREVIRAVAVSGNPSELVGEVLYQEADANDPNVDSARIYVKGVVEVFTENAVIYEIDVDTNNSQGSFVTPYKTVLSADLGNLITDNIVTVDSTLGWPEENGRFRIEDEIITYANKTVNQFLGCTRGRENTSVLAHDAGQEVFAAFKIYGQSNVDGSEIQLKVYGGTKGIILNDGGKYYTPESKVSTPSAPGFDSIDPIWDSFVYNVRKALRGSTATLASIESDGSVVCTVTTKEKHRLNRNDKIRILNADEDIYNNEHDVLGIVDDFQFQFKFSSSPKFGIPQPGQSAKEFFIAREFAFGRSDYSSINTIIKDFTTDVQNTYKSTTDAIVASVGIPSHKIGPFDTADLDPGNQRYLKRIPLIPSVKSTKTTTPIGQIGIGANGVPFYSYKGESLKKFGGLKSINKTNGGIGYDVLNAPIVEFEPTYVTGTTYAIFTRVKVEISSGDFRRYRATNTGKTSTTSTPTHLSGIVTHGSVNWEYEGESAAASVTVSGSVTNINVDNGGSGYSTEPIISIVGGGATSSTQATAVAIITNGAVTGISVVNGGSGYTSIPTISITGGGGQGATATAVCRGPINTINISDAGSQYTYEPTINLISGNGAVAYPSILNGKIESIIVTFGGSGYFGAPDVVITGDGVGATAFAQVDSSSNIVTNIVVTNKGAGYTSGATSISIVYPGSGAIFETKLTELTYNEAATYEELGLASNQFTNRKTTDIGGGGVFKGENDLLYGGEYAYLYNPKQLRFVLKDNIDDQLNELNPTAHSPIIGWAYDGHPIYGPYGFADAENVSPYNSYTLMITSYRVKTTRDALLSGLTDPMGTFIEDYEYVEGLGTLDQYNGRYCVTPEYPNGVYAYFCTIKGVAGEPVFPYFVGPNFYAEADEVNWDGNGVQKNFTEDATRYKAPYIGTDNIVAKRKPLDNQVDFYLALEDTTTLIVMETGEILTYLEDGIGYYSYYPTIRGGTADSLIVSATNKYSSANIDQYLVEGGGKEYKVNDRLLFNNTGTGGEGVSGVVSSINGETVNSLANTVGAQSDLYSTTISTAENHYLVVGDQIVVSVTDNTFERTIKTKIINSKYYFEYFSLTSMKLITPYANTTAFVQGDIIYVADRVYKAAASGTSGSSAPTHTSGTTSDGSLSWTYLRRRTDGNLVQDAWTTNSAGSNYANGTYTDVPLTTNGSGTAGKATIVVSGNSVSSVTITDTGTSYVIGDTISVDNLNIGNGAGGTGFQLTLTQVEMEAECHCDKAHQVTTGNIVDISGITPTEWNKTDYTVIRAETLRRFTIKRNFATIAAANIANAEVYVEEPKLQLILGHSYKFTTEDTSNAGKLLSFTFDPSNTDIFTYKNITDEVIPVSDNEQDSITILVKDLPGIFYYFDLKGNITGSYFTVINDPVTGTNIVSSKTDTTFTYSTALEPESAYTIANGVTFNTTSIYPSGGVATVSIGDAGRNYSSLPSLSGSSRSGSGATAVATISGYLSGTTVTNQGSGYNNAVLPPTRVSLPDYVDLTVSNVFGSFVKDEIVISDPVLGNSTARGQVINWDPTTSILRIKPLQNTRTGAGDFGYIMFAAADVVYSGDSQATISSVSGTQAIVSVVVSGGGKVTSVNVSNQGSNYRSAPSIIMGDPYYGAITTDSTGVSLTTQSSGNYGTGQTYTNVPAASVSPTGGTNAKFTIITDGSGDITSVTCTDGGSTYALTNIITIAGDQLGGATPANDATVTVTALTHADKSIVATLLNASVDTITILNSGSGYLSAPDVIVSGGNGINAKFNASIVNQGVSAINIEDGGVQYQSVPVVTISQLTGSGASVLLKSSDLGKILKVSGDNITYNYSHDRTLKPALNTTFNLQLTRTQVIDYLDVTDGGQNFVSTPEIVLVGGQGSQFVLEPIIQNEVIQSITVVNSGRGFTSAPTVTAKVTHTWVGLKSNSTLNFPYNTKIPLGTKVILKANNGVFPSPLIANTTYYAIAATTANGLADNQIRLATSLANANTGTYVTFTSDPIGDANGITYFTLETTDLGDNITAYMKPATFSPGERIYQGSSPTSYTAYGFVKGWDASGRVVSAEIVEGEFVVGEPVFGEETAAFGQIHEFSKADAVFEVSAISDSAKTWERTTGFLDLNEQRVYDSDRFQEFSYDISSSINITNWKNPLKFAAHPAGFKVVGTQVLSQTVSKTYRPLPIINAASTDTYAWYTTPTYSGNDTFNGTTFITPKPSARATGKLATINNFALGKPDYTAIVPTEVQIFGRQLLDIQKILSCVSYKIDDITDNTISFDGSLSTIVNTSTNRITLPSHPFVDNQRVTYNAGGDRFQDARNLIINNIDYIVEETIGALNASYPSLAYNSSTCARDTRLVVAAWANDLRYDGNFFSTTAAEYYVGGVVFQSNAHADSRNLLLNNKNFIANEVVEQMLADPVVGIPGGYAGVPGGSQNCVDDIVDVIEAVAYNLAYGANSEVWDAANYYVNTVHLDGEETQSVWAFNKAKEFARKVIVNTAITVQGSHGLTQTFDTTITVNLATCAPIQSAQDVLFDIVTTAINNDSLASVTRTNPANHIQHIGGEETETIFAYNKARDLCNLAVTNSLPTGTYTTVAPVTDLSITNDPGGCADVKSAITSFAKIITDAIDNPSTLPTKNIGNYPNARTGTPIGGLTSGNNYYIKFDSADYIQLRESSGGSVINLSSVGTGVGHGFRIFQDGVNTQFKMRTGGIDIGTQIGKTAESKQMFVIVNGIVQNPANYSFANNILTFKEPLLEGSSVLAMYYDRSSYTSSFQLDTIGDELKTFDTTNGLTPGSGYNNGTYTGIILKNRLGSGIGATADITVTNNSVSNVVLNQAGNGYTPNDILGLSEVGSQLTNNYVPTTATYDPASGNLELTIGNHTLTTNDKIRIANDSLTFSCSYGGGGTRAYPRSTDPIGNLFDTPITAITTTTITVNALQGTSPTNTDAHTWQGLSTYQFQPTKVKYYPATGDMILTAAGHGMIKGDRVLIDTDSLTFTCSKDNNATNHTYPRASDPAGGSWLTIDKITTDSFTVNVGKNERFSFTPTNSTYTASTGVLTLTLGNHNLLGAVSHTATNAVYTPADGKVVITVTGHGMSNGDLILIEDDSLSFDCTHGSGTKTYPRSTDPISGKFIEIFDVTNDTFTIQCLETIPSSNQTTHSFVSAVANGIKQAQDVITIKENGLVFTCEMDARSTLHSYPRATDPANGAPLGIYSVTSDTVTTFVGKSPLVTKTPTNAIYDPSNGEMELVIGSHDFYAGQTIKLADGAVSFTCNRDNYRTVHSYPRTAFTGHELTTVYYNPNNGVMTVTSPSHGFSNNDWVKFKPEALAMTCDQDNNVSTKLYPRATDYAYDRWLKVSNVTTNTFDVTVLDIIPSTNISAHTFIAAPQISPSTAAYNATSGIMTITDQKYTVNTGTTYDPQTGLLVMNIGAHNLTTKNSIRIVTDSLTFTCTLDGGSAQKTYPRASGTGVNAGVADYAYQRNLPITAFTANTISVNVNNGGNPISDLSTHTFVSSTTNCIEVCHGLSNGNFVKIKDNSLSFNCTQGVGTKTYPRPSVRTLSASAPASKSVTSATYDPATGLVVLTTPQANTWASAPTQHQVTGATYVPSTGIMTLTIVNHGFTELELIKIDDDALTFKCDEDSQASDHTYPRSTDPISGKWIEIFNVTNDTFDVQVLDIIPSTNVTTHVFQSATATGLSHATSSIRFYPNALSFTCAMDGNTATKTYPRVKDPYYGRKVAVTAVNSTTATVYVGKSPIVNHTGTDGTYDPGTGTLIVEIGAHTLTVGTTVKLANNGFNFQCATDSYGSDHTYPRATAGDGNPDPAYDTAVTILAVTDTTITLNVGISQDLSTHRWKPGFVATNAIQSGGGYTHTWTGGGEAYALNASNSTLGNSTGTQYYPETGILHITTSVAHGMRENDYVKLADNSITFVCEQDNYNTTHSYPRSTDYASGKWLKIFNVTAWEFDVKILDSVPSTNVSKHVFSSSVPDGITHKDPASGNFIEVSNVTHNTFDVQVLTKTPSTNTTTHTFVGADADAVYVAPFFKKKDPFYDTALEIISTSPDSITVDVLTTDQSTSVYKHKFQSALSNSVITGGNYTHKFKSADAGCVNTGDRHTFISAGSNSVTRAIVSHGYHNYDKGADAASLIRKNLNFIATTAYGRMQANNPSFSTVYQTKCLRDTRLLTDAVADNVEFGGNDATYDAAKFYVGSAHLTGEEDESVQVFNHARDICNQIMRNITVTTNAGTKGKQIKDLTITNDSGNNVYDTSDCTDIASTITTLWGIVTTAVGTTAGGSGNLNSVTRTRSSTPDFQINVGSVTFDGTDTTFTTLSGGSTQVLPASDNFLIFLNGTLQIKGTTDAYTYTGSTITFTEPPLPGMDFYGYYFGKLVLLDELAPYFDSSRTTFVMKSDNEPFSLESDNSAVNPANNLMIFINGIFQESGVAYTLRGSVIEFTEAPRASSDCVMFIYTGSANDILVSNTFNSLDPNDRLQVVSEGSDRRIATVSSSSSVDTYEYIGLRPTVAEFQAIITGGEVTQVNITNAGSNYENPPILLFTGGEGSGASAETIIEEGSGKVLSVTNLKGGSGYTSTPTVIATHPVHLERSERNRIVSDSNLLGVSYLTSSVNDSATTLNLRNVWYNTSQKYGFPDQGEVLIPYYNPATDSSGNVIGWRNERILFGAKDMSANTLTVATGGRGYFGTTAFAHNVITGTYSVNQSSRIVTITTASDHNMQTGENRIFLDFTSGTNINQSDAVNYITYIPPDGVYDITRTGSTTFTIQLTKELRRDNPASAGNYLDTGYPGTISGNVSLLPEVRLRTL